MEFRVACTAGCRVVVDVRGGSGRRLSSRGDGSPGDADRARTVCDGQCGCFCHGEGFSAVRELRRERAEGSVPRHDRRGVRCGVARRAGLRALRRGCLDTGSSPRSRRCPPTTAAAAIAAGSVRRAGQPVDGVETVRVGRTVRREADVVLGSVDLCGEGVRAGGVECIVF